MIRRRLFAASAGLCVLALAPQPLAAQAEREMAPAQMAEFADMFAGLFKVDPLTPAQEARLPAARGVVATMLPEGFYAEMMGKMMDSMFAPMMGMFSGETGANLVLGARLALSAEELGALPAEQKVELASLLDPAFTERGQVMQGLLGDVMMQTAGMIEPLFREGLTKAYATRFDDAQLADISAFFATPTGKLYAGESMKLMADPQVMGASMQAMPAMMGQMGDITRQLEAAMAALPPEKRLEELTAAERARAAQLLGVAESDLGTFIKPPRPAAPQGE